jgi:hypothetical protein
MPPAKRGQGGCGDPTKYHKVSRLRRVCVAINGRRRTCKSGTRLANGKCKRAPLSAEQKHTARVQAKMRRSAKTTAEMAALRTKYPRAFKEANKTAATKIGKVGRGFLGRVRAKKIKGAGGLAAMKGHFGF